MTLVYPRLEAERALEHFEEFEALDLKDVRARADAIRGRLPVTFAPTGGIRVNESHLQRLQALLRAQAEDFPNPRSDKTQRRFDLECARILHGHLQAIPGELLRADVWRYLSAALVPDLVLWRFGKADGVSEDRYLGGVRDTLGHLWVRADRLGVEPGGPLALLKEDNLVALMERTVQSRHVALCGAVARRFLEVRPNTGEDEDLLRDVMKRLTRLSGFVSFAAVDDLHVTEFAHEAIRDTFRAFGLEDRVAPKPPALAPPPVATVPAGEPAISTVVTQTPVSSAASTVAVLQWMEAREQARAIWRELVGSGELRVDDAVRMAGIALRDQGLVDYERLRENGPIYETLRGLLDNREFFDIPMRGFRRAVCGTVDEVPDRVLIDLLAEVPDESEDGATQVGLLLELLCERVGFQRATSQRREALERRLEALVVSGELRAVDGRLVPVAGEGS